MCCWCCCEVLKASKTCGPSPFSPSVPHSTTSPGQSRQSRCGWGMAGACVVSGGAWVGHVQYLRVARLAGPDLHRPSIAFIRFLGHTSQLPEHRAGGTAR